MDDTVKQSIQSVIRTLLAAAGSWLVAKGLLDNATMNNALGAIMVIIPVVWGIWDKYKTASNTKVREANALNVGIALSNQDPNQTPLVPASEAPKVLASMKGTV